LPLILLAIIVFLTIIAAPSGFYAKAKEASPTTAPANSSANSNSNSNKQQYCDLYVPPITGSDSPELQDQANMTYRFVYTVKRGPCSFHPICPLLKEIHYCTYYYSYAYSNLSRAAGMLQHYLHWTFM
jgi:hypothetical protein